MIHLIPVDQFSEYEEVLKVIYLHAFPPDERRDWQELIAFTVHSHFNLYCIINNNEPAGLITLWKWPELTFIEHFAIAESLQGKGIGTKVLNLVMQQVSTGIILETEEPTTEAASHRIAFYSRLGFHVCKEAYYQPPYALDKKAVKMMLMSYPDQITQNDFLTIKTRLYKDVYQVSIT